MSKYIQDDFINEIFQHMSLEKMVDLKSEECKTIDEYEVLTYEVSALAKRLSTIFLEKKQNIVIDEFKENLFKKFPVLQQREQEIIITCQHPYTNSTKVFTANLPLMKTSTFDTMNGLLIIDPYSSLKVNGNRDDGNCDDGCIKYLRPGDGCIKYLRTSDGMLNKKHFTFHIYQGSYRGAYLGEHCLILSIEPKN